MKWSPQLSSKTYTKANTLMRRKFNQEYQALVKKLGTPAKAHAELNRIHYQEYRECVNQAALQTGLSTTEVRRANMIAKMEARLKELKDKN